MMTITMTGKNYTKQVFNHKTGKTKLQRYFTNPDIHKQAIQITPNIEKALQNYIKRTGNLEIVQNFIQRTYLIHALNLEFTSIPIPIREIVKEMCNIDTKESLIKHYSSCDENSTDSNFYKTVLLNNGSYNQNEKKLFSTYQMLMPIVLSLCIAVKSGCNIRCSQDVNLITQFKESFYPKDKEGKPIKTASLINKSEKIFFNLWNVNKLKIIFKALDEFGFIKLEKGELIPEAGKGYQTTMIPQQKFINIFRKFENQINFSTLNYRRNIESLEDSDERIINNDCPITIKDKKKDPISIDQFTPQMLQQIEDEHIIENVKLINIQYKKLNVNIKLTEIKNNRDILNKLRTVQAGLGYIDNDGLLNYNKVEMVRIFNNSKLSDGGRIYNPLQNNSKLARAGYELCGEKVTSLDMQASQIGMLYHLEGLECTCKDPYDLYENYKGSVNLSTELLELSRKMVKKITLTMINSKSDRQAVLASYKEVQIKDNNQYITKLKKLKYDCDTEHIVSLKKYKNHHGMRYSTEEQRKHLQFIANTINAIKIKHTPISKYFNSGEGVRLQKRESDIVINTINGMFKKHNAIALSVHDEVIVQESLICELYNEFITNYKKHFDFECVLTDPTGIDFKTTEQYINFEHNIYKIKEDQLKSNPKEVQSTSSFNELPLDKPKPEPKYIPIEMPPFSSFDELPFIESKSKDIPKEVQSTSSFDILPFIDPKPRKIQSFSSFDELPLDKPKLESESKDIPKEMPPFSSFDELPFIESKPKDIPIETNQIEEDKPTEINQAYNHINDQTRHDYYGIPDQAQEQARLDIKQKKESEKLHNDIARLIAQSNAQSTLKNK